MRVNWGLQSTLGASRDGVNTVLEDDIKMEYLLHIFIQRVMVCERPQGGIASLRRDTVASLTRGRLFVWLPSSSVRAVQENLDYFSTVVVTRDGFFQSRYMV